MSALLRQSDMVQRDKALPVDVADNGVADNGGADTGGEDTGEVAWSVQQILGHMAEMIPYWLNQCDRLIAATGEPPRFGRALDSPERLAGVELGAAGGFDETLGRVEGEIQAAAQAIRQMTPAERAKAGDHLRYGEMSVEQVIERFIIAHAEEHLAQVQATLRI
jgi:uncharacterized damage-inducible protein DinB